MGAEVALRAWWLALALSGSAFAEDATDGVEAAVGDEGVYEVRVYGPDAVIEARRALIRDMEGLGWWLVDERGGDAIFRGPRGWMGRAIVSREALLEFTAPTFLAQDGDPDAIRAGRGPSAQRALALDVAHQGGFPGLDSPSIAAATGLDSQMPQFTLGSMPSQAKLQGVRDRVVVGINPALLTYREAIQETAFQESLEALERNLDALWELGVPLVQGAPRIEGQAERRAAALDYWASRSDTSHGRRTCEVVERWLVTVVAPSNAPITPEEAAAAEQIAQATHHRSLPDR